MKENATNDARRWIDGEISLGRFIHNSNLESCCTQVMDFAGGIANAYAERERELVDDMIATRETYEERDVAQLQRIRELEQDVKRLNAALDAKLATCDMQRKQMNKMRSQSSYCASFELRQDKAAFASGGGANREAIGATYLVFDLIDDHTLRAVRVGSHWFTRQEPMCARALDASYDEMWERLAK